MSCVSDIRSGVVTSLSCIESPGRGACVPEQLVCCVLRLHYTVCDLLTFHIQPAGHVHLDNSSGASQLFDGKRVLQYVACQ